METVQLPRADRHLRSRLQSEQRGTGDRVARGWVLGCALPVAVLAAAPDRCKKGRTAAPPSSGPGSNDRQVHPANPRRMAVEMLAQGHDEVLLWKGFAGGHGCCGELFGQPAVSAVFFLQTIDVENVAAVEADLEGGS